MMPRRSLSAGLLLFRFRIILVLFQLGLGRPVGGNSALGHFCLGTPGDGIEHKRAKIIVSHKNCLSVAEGAVQDCAEQVTELLVFGDTAPAGAISVDSVRTAWAL